MKVLRSRPWRALGWTLIAIAAGSVWPLLSEGSLWLRARWEHPWLLALTALLLPLWWWVFLAAADHNPRLQVGWLRALHAAPENWRIRLLPLPPALRWVSLVLVILALARPQSLDRGESSDANGIDIGVALDLSGSMRAILDTDPSGLPGGDRLKQGDLITRLDAAKLVLQDFIARRHTDRIGIVVFGKSAYVLSPATRDYKLLTSLVARTELGVVDGTGTAIGDALATSVARLRRGEAASKVVVLITDGDNTDGSVAPETAAELAKGQGIVVHTIQIGAKNEALVQAGTDFRGRPVLREETLPVNPELLKKIADTTGGQAFIASDAASLSRSMHTILDGLERTTLESGIASYHELFPSLVLSAALLLLLEIMLRAFLLRRSP